MNQHNTFADWLQTATRGLPKNVLPLVQAELSAHYEDAIEDYILYGKSVREAQDAALADLGDVDETAHALQQIHLAPRRYLLAALACVSPLLFVMIVIPTFVLMAKFAWIIVLLYPLSFGCTLFVLNSFCTLLPYHRLRLPLNIMFAGMSVSLAMVILTVFFAGYLGVVGRWAVLYFYETILNYAFLPAQGYNDIFVDALIIGSVIVTGVGALLFGRRILHVADALTQVLALIFIASGIVMMLNITAIVAHNATAALLFSPLITILLLAKYAACALLFFRAARGGSAFPTRTA